MGGSLQTLPIHAMVMIFGLNGPLPQLTRTTGSGVRTLPGFQACFMMASFLFTDSCFHPQGSNPFAGSGCSTPEDIGLVAFRQAPVAKFRIAGHQGPERLASFRQGEHLPDRLPVGGGDHEKAGPAAAKPGSRGGEFKGGQGDGRIDRAATIVAWRMSNDEGRRAPQHRIGAVLPGPHHP